MIAALLGKIGGLSTRKGLALSFFIAVLFGLLLSVALQQEERKQEAGQVMNEIMAAKKVIYVFEDIQRDLNYPMLDMEITKNGQNLTIQDHLPSDVAIIDRLDKFSEFTHDHYETDDIHITYLNMEDEEFEFDELESGIEFPPTGIIYKYDEEAGGWQKNSVSLLCKKEKCYEIDTLKIYLNLSNDSFRYEPGSANFSTWEPGDFATDPPPTWCSHGECCGPHSWLWRLFHGCLFYFPYGTSQDGCAGADWNECNVSSISFLLQITDSGNLTYNQTQIAVHRENEMDLEGTECNYKIILGGLLETEWIGWWWVSGDYYRYYSLSAYKANEEDGWTVPCDTQFDARTFMRFKNESYQVNLPFKLKIEEVNYNITKIEPIYEIGE